jgi:putative Ca2+/H+ antiporter (TMEM165/GDT1 family)
MKIVFLLKFSLFIILGILIDNTFARIENINIEKYNLKQEKHLSLSKMIDVKQISELLETVFTITKCGLFEKSFLINVVLFMNYDTRIVIVSAFISITSIQFFSIYVNIFVTLRDSIGIIDIIASIFFIIFGIFKIVEGIRYPQYENQEKIKEIQNEINRNISLEESIGMTESNLDKSFIIKENEINPKINFQALLSALITVTCIVLSEAGDKTQFSTIYVTTNSSKYLIITSFLIAHLILLSLSAFFASGISCLLNKKAVFIVSGSTFIYYAIICCHLIYIHNYLLLRKSKQMPSAVTNFVMKNNKIKLLKKL